MFLKIPTDLLPKQKLAHHRMLSVACTASVTKKEWRLSSRESASEATCNGPGRQTGASVEVEACHFSLSGFLQEPALSAF